MLRQIPGDRQGLRDCLLMVQATGASPPTCCTSVFITATGVVVVDTKIPGWGLAHVSLSRRCGESVFLDDVHRLGR